MAIALFCTKAEPILLNPTELKELYMDNMLFMKISMTIFSKHLLLKAVKFILPASMK